MLIRLLSVDEVMWCRQQSVNHQELLCSLHCTTTVVLREQLNFKSTVIRSERSSCFFMSGRLYWIIYSLFMPNFFLLGPLCNVNFTANLASRGFIGIFDHIFYGYSNRQLHFPHINIAHIGQLDFESRNL